MKPVTVKSVERYVPGTNALLDAINPENKRVYLVQGNIGRRPIIAPNEDEAVDKYKAKKAVVLDEPVSEDE